MIRSSGKWTLMLEKLEIGKDRFLIFSVHEIKLCRSFQNNVPDKKYYSCIYDCYFSGKYRSQINT